MKKAVGHLSALLKAILFIGFSIQIVLGLVWMCFHFVQVQPLGEPEGLLYPLLLRIFGGMPQFLYLLQLGFAWFAARALLGPILGQGIFWQSWQVLALITLPFAMQCHMALLPYSFVCSFLFLEVSFCREAINGGENVRLVELAGAAACWLALALLLPEYGWLGGFPPALTVLLRIPVFIRQFRKMVYCVLIIAAFGGMIAGMSNLADPLEKQGRTFWFSLAHRTAWPTVWHDFHVWPEEMQGIVEPVVWDTTYNSGNMERLLRPAIENAVGAEQAESYYRQMASIAWQLHGPVIVRQMFWDALVYTLPQVMLPLQLEGMGYDTYSGRNYEVMLGRQPRLTSYYVRYSCWWFKMALGATASLTVLGLASKERVSGWKVSGFLIMCVLSAGAVTAYYVMRGAGMSDYKCTIAVSAAWTVWSLYTLSERNRGQEKAGKDA